MERGATRSQFDPAISRGILSGSKQHVSVEWFDGNELEYTGCTFLGSDTYTCSWAT